MKKRALVNLRHVHGERWRSFITGLRRCGFETVVDKTFEPREHDIFVTWNRFPVIEDVARNFEHVGATVIVAENPWIKAGGDKRGGMVSLCVGHHNGAGSWLVGGPERWHSFGIELKPWRTSGRRILVLPQRGYGERGIAMHSGWPSAISDRIAQFTSRPVTIRPHPGLFRPKEPDFSKTWAAVTWASGAAIKALVAGIPVFYEMPNWIGSTSAKFGLRDIEKPYIGNREPTFVRLAWAQWFLDEIETGEPFMRCLSLGRNKSYDQQIDHFLRTGPSYM